MLGWIYIYVFVLNLKIPIDDSASVYMKSSYSDTHTNVQTFVYTPWQLVANPITSGTDRCSQTPAKKLIRYTYYCYNFTQTHAHTHDFFLLRFLLNHGEGE